jgi:F-type H+-transporting ATPase subunit delta
MKHKNNCKDYAKKLVQIALQDGQVSSEKVSAILETLKTRPQRELTALLKSFHYYLRREMRNSHIRIEYAGQIRESTAKALQKSFSKKYNRPLTVVTEEAPKLIAGIRVAVADDVYNATVANRLAALRLATA